MTKKLYTHAQQAKIDEVINCCIAKENSIDLSIHSDACLAELIRRQGIEITPGNACHYRKRLGIPGTPTRAKALIAESQKENKKRGKRK